jgi:hypothetical protein
VQAVASVGLWLCWTAVLVATLVPHPLGLTTLRVGAPAAVAVALAAVAATGDGTEEVTAWAALALVSSSLVLFITWLPETTFVFVNGPAYPNERRFPLRVPVPLLVGIVPAAWALALGPIATGVLLLATGQWLAGAGLLALGLPVAFVMLRALHGLSRRWLVFVPAGLVLHDPMSLTDPVLYRRQVIDVLRPAPADSDALDLTQAAFGLALELVLKEEVPMVLTTPGRRAGEAGSFDRLLITPNRPGAVLAEARSRRIPTGLSSDGRGAARG